MQCQPQQGAGSHQEIEGGWHPSPTVSPGDGANKADNQAQPLQAPRLSEEGDIATANTTGKKEPNGVEAGAAQTNATLRAASRTKVGAREQAPAKTSEKPIIDVTQHQAAVEQQSIGVTPVLLQQPPNSLALLHTAPPIDEVSSLDAIS